ncbi:NACHT domain-containing protein [Sulfitobacter sp. 1A12157]|uniref:NACHT domain-containing protein n=1 Tax=Sulfitobacter sp. 1A12157 TaxID=3368594 RepID=UPI003745E52D
MADLSNNVGNAAIQTLVDKTLGAFFDAATKHFGVTKAKYFSSFQKYYILQARRCSTIKTLNARDVSQNLQDIYVSLRFDCLGTQYSDQEVLETILAGRRIILRGKGGSGKSMFMRWLFLSLMKSNDNRIPILIELRKFDSTKASNNLLDLCRKTLYDDGNLSESVFTQLCKDGKFIFLFDGFDEVPREQRTYVETEILELSERYPDCGVAVSGRDNDHFFSWAGFSTCDLCSLSYVEVQQVIERAYFESSLKENFLKILSQDFFDLYGELLSTPLLSIMLAMTYGQNGSLPTNLNEFYNRAFHTLVMWHDASKDGYSRDLSISPEKFRAVFRIFCLMTYLDNKFEFDDSYFVEHIGKAKSHVVNLSGMSDLLDISTADLRRDFHEGTNLIVREGFYYFFIHRSFQEFFAAECATSLSDSNFRSVLSNFCERHTDSTLSMCYEMQQDRFIWDFLEPIHAQLLAAGTFNSSDDAPGILHRLAVSSYVVISPRDLGGGSANTEVSDKAVRTFFSAMDLVRGRRIEWLTLLSRFSSSIKVLEKLPQNLYPANGITLEITWRQTGELRFEINTLDGSVMSERQKHQIIDKCLPSIELAVADFSVGLSEYVSESIDHFARISSQKAEWSLKADDIL